MVTPTSHGRHGRQNRCVRQRRGVESSFDTTMHSWSNLNVSLRERNNRPLKPTTMEQAMCTLQAMSDMEERLFYFACKKLRDPTNRAMFLVITSDERHRHIIKIWIDEGPGDQMSYVDDSDTYEEEVEDLPKDIDSDLENIEDNEAFETSLMDCIGAIDGTIIPAWVGAGQQGTYKCRKRFLTQNVMLACDFDLKFTLVLAGWEDSANDARVFNDTLSDPTYRFPFPPPGNSTLTTFRSYFT
ncbi:Unknown protein [Striga hermonthica]|uniref:Uncharacterized protein n=1 Tax=Striga hermonthica TaxID=68872 RepID=A0A9N7NWK3_STRHE|nr:Unknown protein [Striga hermonthica]